MLSLMLIRMLIRVLGIGFGLLLIAYAYWQWSDPSSLSDRELVGMAAPFVIGVFLLVFPFTFAGMNARDLRDGNGSKPWPGTSYLTFKLGLSDLFSGFGIGRSLYAADEVMKERQRYRRRKPSKLPQRARPEDSTE